MRAALAVYLAYFSFCSDSFKHPTYGDDGNWRLKSCLDAERVACVDGKPYYANYNDNRNDQEKEAAR
jgi:hypothetical protein